MEAVPLAYTAWERVFADLPPAVLRNRFFEQNPTQETQAVLLARPGSSLLGVYGLGPIRATYSLPGLFGGALFFVSGEELFRRDPDGTTFAITGIVFGDGEVVMTGLKGPGYEHLFIADGSHLQVYRGGTHASATLTGTGHVADGDTIQIGETWYRWTDPVMGAVGTGDGTFSNPWKVLRGADLAEDMENMVKALNFVGTPGVDWSANLGGKNPDVTAELSTDTVPDSLTVTAKVDTAAGNLIEVSVDSSDTVPAVDWGAAALSGGGTHGLSGIEVPDGQPPISVCALKGYALVAIGGTQRVYFIKPGEITIDALDFFSAESMPDDIVSVVRVGDTAWLIGEGSCEVWFAVGNLDAPFAPITGRVYDRGAIPGTVVESKGVVYLVGPDHVVYAISGSPRRISNHGVEEAIRSVFGG